MNLQPSRLRQAALAAIGACAILLFFYLTTYSILSYTGGWVVSESGENRLAGIHLATADVFEWQPRYGSSDRFRSLSGDYELRADSFGYFFAPLILLDQHFVHRTIPFITADLHAVEPPPAPPLSQYHPLRANRWHGRFPYEH